MLSDDAVWQRFGRLNHNAVPARAMTFGLVLNAWLLFQFPTVFFILAVGNLGFLLALSSFLSSAATVPAGTARFGSVRSGSSWRPARAWPASPSSPSG